MAKPHETSPSSSKAATGVLALGAVAVVGLLAWALTRTVAPEPAAEPATAAAEPAPPAPATSAAGAPAATVPVTVDGMTTSPFSTSPAFNPPTTPSTHVQDAEHAAVPRMAVEDLRAKLDRGEVVVVDVRDQGSFERSHIPGALHVALSSVEANLSLLPKTKTIVTYCTWPAEESSAGAALIMQKNGYSNVHALYGGFAAWESLGYPTKSGPGS
jgi:rhodanese-related sulfurtransferase